MDNKEKVSGLGRYIKDERKDGFQRERAKMFSMREVFDLAMRIEENGEFFYRGALKQVSDPSARAMLEWLADEEVKHKVWFASKKDAVKMKKKEIALEEMGSDILKGIMGDQNFSLKEADLSEIRNQKDLINLAIEFEKDTILFFEMIRSLVEDLETLDQLKEIIAEENHHIQMLQDFQGQGGDRTEKEEKDHE